ncbi:MAG TPA: hypothetical protein VGW35_00440 [Methylomirabilota bacterium]|nr:hypothetical protein [Methylomirabilota bacterium]
MGLLALAATPLYLAVEPSAKPVVVRLAVAAVLGVALIHLRGEVRAQIAAQPPSAFERALARVPVESHLAPIFVTLREEIRISMRSHGYFAQVLWPRLLDLAARRPGGPPATCPARPGGRRLLRRGPPLATLRALIAGIEERT